MPHLSSKRCISFSAALCRRRRRVGYFALPSRKIKRPLSIQFPLTRFDGRTEELFLPRHSERCPPYSAGTMPSHYIIVH